MNLEEIIKGKPDGTEEKEAEAAQESMRAWSETLRCRKEENNKLREEMKAVISELVRPTKKHLHLAVYQRSSCILICALPGNSLR